MITTSFILSEREPSKRLVIKRRKSAKSAAREAITAQESIIFYFSSSFIDHRSSPYARLPHIGENALEKISEGHRLGRRRPLSHLTKYFQK